RDRKRHRRRLDKAAPGARTDRSAAARGLPVRQAAPWAYGLDHQRWQREPSNRGYTARHLMIPVKEVMTRNVITFREDTPVEEIAQTLSSRRITGAPVVAGDGLVVGIVSEVDVFSKKGAVAKDIMSPHVISVTEDTGIDEAARLLAGERI